MRWGTVPVIGRFVEYCRVNQISPGQDVYHHFFSFSYGDRPSDICRDRTYPTRHVTDLPRSVRLSDRRDTVLSVDYARKGQLSVCRRMVDEAAKAGDDVGEDEYKDDDDYGLLLSHSEVFVATCERTREAKAFVVIQPCLTSRFATKHIQCASAFERLSFEVN